MNTEVRKGWPIVVDNSEPKYYWNKALKKAQNKDILQDKLAQINHIFSALEKQHIMNRNRMKLVMDIPPSTLGYTPNDWIASWENNPMTKDEIEKISEESQEAYERGTLEAPSKIYIAVGYVLVQEEVEH